MSRIVVTLSLVDLASNDFDVTDSRNRFALGLSLVTKLHFVTPLLLAKLHFAQIRPHFQLSVFPIDVPILLILSKNFSPARSFYLYDFSLSLKALGLNPVCRLNSRLKW